MEGMESSSIMLDIGTFERQVREPGAAPTLCVFVNIHSRDVSRSLMIDPEADKSTILMKIKVKTLGNTVYDLEMKPEVSESAHALRCNSLRRPHSTLLPLAM